MLARVDIRFVAMLEYANQSTQLLELVWAQACRKLRAQQLLIPLVCIALSSSFESLEQLLQPARRVHDEGAGQVAEGHIRCRHRHNAATNSVQAATVQLDRCPSRSAKDHGQGRNAERRR